MVQMNGLFYSRPMAFNLKKFVNIFIFYINLCAAVFETQNHTLDYKILITQVKNITIIDIYYP